MTGGIILFDELREITGLQQPAAVASALRKQGVHVFESRKGPWTTIALINAAGGIKQDAANEPGYGAELF